MADDDTKQNQGEAIDVKADTAGKGKSSIIVMIVLSVLVMVLTPIITVFVVKSMMPKAVEEAKPKKNIQQIKLPDINVNISGTQGFRYVSISIVIELNRSNMDKYFLERTAENPDGMLNKIQSEIINLVSDKRIEGLLSSQAKRDLANEIKFKLNEILLSRTETEGQVVDVYFPKFLIQ